MPMGEYTNFADCVSKNKSKDDPKAYCGYIKQQIEGGKKKEEVMDFPEHELFHLEETLKKEVGRKYPISVEECPKCGAEPTQLDDGSFECIGCGHKWHPYGK